MIAVYKIFQEKNPKYWLLLAVSLTILLQLHYSTPYLLIVIPLIAIMSGFKLSKQDFRFASIAAGLFFVSFIPFMIYLFTNFTSEANNFRLVFDFTFLEKILTSIKGIGQISTGLALRRTLGNDIAFFNAYIGKWAVILSYVLYASTVVFFILGAVYAVKRFKDNFILRYCLTVFCAALAFIILISTRTGGYYLLSVYPIPFLFIALGLDLLKWRQVKVLFTVILVSLNIFITLSFQNFIRENNGSSGDYQIPYRIQSKYGLEGRMYDKDMLDRIAAERK